MKKNIQTKRNDRCSKHHKKTEKKKILELFFEYGNNWEKIKFFYQNQKKKDFKSVLYRILRKSFFKVSKLIGLNQNSYSKNDIKRLSKLLLFINKKININLRNGEIDFSELLNKFSLKNLSKEIKEICSFDGFIIRESFLFFKNYYLRKKKNFGFLKKKTYVKSFTQKISEIKKKKNFIIEDNLIILFRSKNSIMKKKFEKKNNFFRTKSKKKYFIVNIFNKIFQLKKNNCLHLFLCDSLQFSINSTSSDEDLTSSEFSFLSNY